MAIDIKELRKQLKGTGRARSPRTKFTKGVMARRADGTVLEFASAKEAVELGYATKTCMVYLACVRTPGKNGKPKLHTHHGYQWKYVGDTEPWPPFPEVGRQYKSGADHVAAIPIIGTDKDGVEHYFGSVRDAGRKLGAKTHSNIYRALPGPSQIYKRAHGMTWRRAEESIAPPPAKEPE